MSAIGPRPFNVDAEYEKLGNWPKFVITIAYYATAIFTFGTRTASVYEYLVRKFSVLDLNEDTEQSKSAVKTQDVALDKIVELDAPSDVQSESSSKEVISKTPPIDTSDIIDHLEKEFWEWMYSSNYIKTFQLIASMNKDQPSVVANYVLEEFFKQRKGEIIDPKQRKNLSTCIEDNIRKALKDEFVLDLEDANETIEKTTMDGKVIQIFSTCSDGSCGMHAISGEVKNGKYECDAVVERALFIHWIRDNNKYPEAVLGDYFTHFDQAPQGFKNNATTAKYTELRANYDTLTPEEKEKRTEAFIRDPAIREAYLLNLANPSVYLLQDELAQYAEYKKVNLILFQKGWGRDADKLVYTEIETPGATSTVGVYYNGIDHYSRAQIKPA